MRNWAVLFLTIVVVGTAVGRRPEFDEWQAVQESLSCVHPRLRASWLAERGYDNSYYTTFRKPDSNGLRMVGKYGRGPSVEVTGQDTLVALTLGSEVALLSFANPDSPRVLSEIQLDYLPSQSAIRDTLLYTCGNGLEVWDIADATRPERLTVIPRAVGDFSLQDTFLYFVSQDTFWVYSVADPENPYSLGCCRDSGYVATSTVSTVVLALPQDALGFVDVSDPSAPQRVGSRSGWVQSAAARGNLCCVAFADPGQPENSWLLALDISNPASPQQLSRLDGACGYDMCLVGQYAFLSGRSSSYEPFQVVNISDSTLPSLVGELDLPKQRWGVWSDLAGERAYVAASAGGGLTVVDISNPAQPQVDTVLMEADVALDVCVDGGRAYVAERYGGLRVVDVSDPSQPAEFGGTAGAQCYSVAARDSFAFTGWWPGPYFRTLLVVDPTRPDTVGSGSVETIPEDMVLSDSLVFLAGRLRFNVVNVARPREPVLVGSCVAGDATSAGLALQDTLAFVGNFVSQVINVADPANPVVVGTFNRGAWNVSPRDTLAFVSSGGVLVYDVVVPTNPYIIDSISLGPNTYWVEAVGSLLYTGNRDGVHVVDASDVHNMREVGFCSTPYSVKRLHYSPPYIYAACWDAGVCIFESTQVAIAEPADTPPSFPPQFRAEPCPAATRIQLVGLTRQPDEVAVRDITGRVVATPRLSRGSNIDVGGLPSGLYFVEVLTDRERRVAKFVKR